MLVNGDARALEWLTCVYLSQDPVAIEELWKYNPKNPKEYDQHTDNQQRFGLPSRLIAKIFLFRLIFGGSAFSYAHDPDFAAVSSDPKFWQGVIDAFYEKYRGVGTWHKELMRMVVETGRIVLPTGRIFTYQTYTDKSGSPTWPRTTILNYPVQGLGADLMMMARQALVRRVWKAGLESKFVSTVHDSVMFDCPAHEVDTVVGMFYSVWDDLPGIFEQMTGQKFNLPCHVEVSVGQNWGNMTEVPRA